MSNPSEIPFKLVEQHSPDAIQKAKQNTRCVEFAREAKVSGRHTIIALVGLQHATHPLVIAS